MTLGAGDLYFFHLITFIVSEKHLSEVFLIIFLFLLRVTGHVKHSSIFIACQLTR